MIERLLVALLDVVAHALLTGIVLLWVLRRVHLTVHTHCGDDGDDGGGDEITVPPREKMASRDEMRS